MLALYYLRSFKMFPGHILFGKFILSVNSEIDIKTNGIEGDKQVPNGQLKFKR